MKLIIQKGIAGLCDRLFTLGRCLLFADSYKAKIFPDWRDEPTWCEGFFRYFAFPESYHELPETLGTIVPPHWTPSLIQHPTAKIALGGHSASQQYKGLESDWVTKPWDTLVVFRCSGVNERVASRLCKSLRITDEVKAHVAQVMQMYSLCAGQYDIVHYRNRENNRGTVSTDVVYKRLAEVKNPVLITDDPLCKQEAARRGFICPSVLPAHDPNEARSTGSHHSKNFEPGQTKHDINMSAITDLIIGGKARTFVSYGKRVGHSAFEGLILNGRKYNWSVFTS